MDFDRSVRLVMMSFEFSDMDQVPHAAREVDWREFDPTRTSKPRRFSGELVIPETRGCSAAEFDSQLTVYGYQLVDAFWQERRTPNNWGKRSYLARFTFCRKEHVDISEVFRSVAPRIMDEMRSLSSSGSWRICVYNNPFYQRGQPIVGIRSVSINLREEEPLRTGSARFQLKLENRRVQFSPA